MISDECCCCDVNIGEDLGSVATGCTAIGSGGGSCCRGESAAQAGFLNVELDRCDHNCSRISNVNLGKVIMSQGLKLNKARSVRLELMPN